MHNDEYVKAVNYLKPWAITTYALQPPTGKLELVWNLSISNGNPDNTINLTHVEDEAQMVWLVKPLNNLSASLSAPRLKEVVKYYICGVYTDTSILDFDINDAVDNTRVRYFETSGFEIQPPDLFDVIGLLMVDSAPWRHRHLAHVKKWHDELSTKNYIQMYIRAKYALSLLETLGVDIPLLNDLYSEY